MNTKVEVILNHKHEAFKEVLPVGFKTELESILSDSDKVIHNGNKNTPPQIAPKGNYEGYRFKGANGHIYDDTFITNWLGHATIDKIFKILN